MESPFKKFMKTIGLFIILVLVSFVGFKYQYLKKEGKLQDVWNQSKTKNDVVYVEGELADPYKESNTEKDESDLKQEEVSSDNNFFTEKQNYDDYYNKFNFDNFFLVYEGEQQAQETIIVINRLIKNIDDTLYSKPMVEFIGFNGLSTNAIGPGNLEEYRLVLNQAKADVKGHNCTIEFGYATFNSVVNKIIITKK